MNEEKQKYWNDGIMEYWDGHREEKINGGLI